MNDIVNEKEIELKICNQIKNLLMIVIVLYHSCYMWHGDTWGFDDLVFDSSSFNYYLYYLLQPLHIRIFLIISGYIYAFSKNEKNKYQKFGSLLINKTKRLIVPYLLIGLIYQIPINVIIGREDLLTSIIELFIGKSADQLWFLLSLFLMFMIIYPLDKLLNKKPVVVLVISLGFLGLSYLTEGLLIDCLFMTSTLRCFMFFVLGYIFRRYGTNIIRKIKPILVFILYIVIFIIAMILQGYENNIVHLIGSGLYYSTFVVFPELFFGAMLNLFEKVNNYDSKFNKFLSSHSMNIYLLHQQIIYFSILLINNKIHPILLVLVSFVSSFLISLLLSMLLKTNKITRFMTGELVIAKNDK